MQSFECVILHHKTTNITNNNMKRLTLILMLVLSMVTIVSAEQKSVPLEYKKTCNDNKHTKVHRAPERIPVINVYYDNDTHLITVESEETADAEVFLYDDLGNVIDYSPTLNVVLYIDSAVSGIPYIFILGNTWTATGYIQK